MEQNYLMVEITYQVAIYGYLFLDIGNFISSLINRSSYACHRSQTLWKWIATRQLFSRFSTFNPYALPQERLCRWRIWLTLPVLVVAQINSVNTICAIPSHVSFLSAICSSPVFLSKEKTPYALKKKTQTLYALSYNPIHFEQNLPVPLKICATILNFFQGFASRSRSLFDETMT